MNKVQRNYMMAKAELQTCEELARDIEKEYIIENGIRNNDGGIPARVYCIDDMDIFNRANEETVRNCKNYPRKRTGSKNKFCNGESESC